MKWWNNLCFRLRDWFEDWSARFSEERGATFSTTKGRMYAVLFVILVVALAFGGYKGYRMYLVHDYTLRANAAYQAEAYQEAIKNYEELALLGDENGLFKAAQMYLEGTGIPKDQKTAITYLHTAADLGSTEAMTKLGMLYYASGFTNRTCLGHNYRQAYYWFNKAGKTPEALEALGTMYQKGLGVEQNDKLAQNYFDKWVDVYAHQANEGDAKAQYMLGNYYSDGVRHSVDEEKAVAWYEKSAQQGYIPALEVLGFIYNYGGEKIKQDHQKATKIYQKLRSIYEEEVKAGKVDAMLALSSMYSSGFGMEKNVQKSVEYLQLATAKGSATAFEILADVAEREGVALPNNQTPEDLRLEAIRHKELEASRGNISVMKELGFRALSENHEEVNPFTGVIKSGVDYVSAIKWFTAAANAGDAPAMLELGRIYNETTDQGIKSLKLAEYWFKKSADQCYEPAYFELGALYSKPDTPYENAKVAQSWYELAATQGTQEAQLMLSRALASGGKGAQPDYENALKWLLVVKYGVEKFKDTRSELMKEILILEQKYSHYLTDEEIKSAQQAALIMREKYGTEW